MRCFVTGGAGFIGSQMCDRLLQAGHQVVAYDNFSSGQLKFLEFSIDHANFKLIEGDLLDLPSLEKASQGCEFVFHFSANADVRFGVQHPSRDLEQNTIATFNVLQAMTKNGIKKIVFSSTGSIYGEPQVHPTPEDAPFPIQTSLYGASKLAGEGMIAAFREGMNVQAWIFRFVSILGERYSHGHVFDFYKQLLADPTQLKVLGDGHQRKSYLYVHDCVDAIFKAIESPSQKVNVYNLGTDEFIEVRQSVQWIVEGLGLNPKLNFSGGTRGWVGDSPFIYLKTDKIRSLGWKPKLTIREGLLRTLTYLQNNKWLLEARK